MSVYFIRAGEDGPIKIGHAEDVAARIAELQAGNHLRLQLLRQIAGGRAEEAWLHRRFAGLRVRGEWFSFDQAMLSIVPPEVELQGFAALLAQWPSLGRLAEDCGVGIETARQWRKRDSVPSWYWRVLVDSAARHGIGSVTFDSLAALAGRRGAEDFSCRLPATRGIAPPAASLLLGPDRSGRLSSASGAL